METFNKALKYLNKNRPDKAISLFKKLPEYKEVLLNLGTAYRLLGDDDSAAQYYIKASKPEVPFSNNTFSSKYPIALNNLGLIAYTYEHDDVAVEFYNAALEDDPLYYDALWNLGNTRLRQYCSGKFPDLKTCLELYEFRYKRSDTPVRLKSKVRLPLWTGEPVTHLCVMAEQGFGDQLMFGRYLEQAAAVCDKITVQCHDRARAIFNKYPTCGDPIETNATHGIGICSLAKIFNNVPQGDWLHDKYVPKVKNSVLDIGVTWSGNSNHVNDRYRSTTSNTFKPLASCGNLYTLNPTEANTSGFTTLKSGNWGETISELSKLDVVVCVDTSIAHLCGALGMPCYVIMATKNNDFRWGDSSMGMNNIWYPSVKVIRNNNGWEDAILRVKNELKNL